MGKKSAPSPDPNIGKAALDSASLGRDYLAWMKDQAKITNAWAEEDRIRYKTVFQPVEDRLVTEAVSYDTPERRQAAALEATADVSQQSALARDASERRMAAMGVDPRSGAYSAEARRGAMAQGLGAAGASNLARKQVEATGTAMTANAANIGRGFAVNPATSMGLSNNAAASGFQGAIGGAGQQGQLLNQQYQNQLSAWNSQNDLWGGIGQGIGMIIGASDKNVKENKRPVRGVLEVIEKMPAERWKYKKGVADEGEHIGPYAQDMKKATGIGDGKTVNFLDIAGVTLAGVQELAKEVKALKRERTREAA